MQQLWCVNTDSWLAHMRPHVQFLGLHGQVVFLVLPGGGKVELNSWKQGLLKPPHNEPTTFSI